MCEYAGRMGEWVCKNMLTINVDESGAWYEYLDDGYTFK